MEGFERVLRRVDRRLEAPEPERSRILLEMAGDLEDLYETYRRRGIGDAEARRKAVEWFDLSDEAAEELRSVHVPWLGRVLDQLEGSTRGRVEASLLGLVALAAAASGLGAALRVGLHPTSPGVWAVALLAAAGVAAALRCAHTLWLGAERHDPGALRGWLTAQLVAAVGAALAGALAGVLRLALGTSPGSGMVPWSEVAAASAVTGLGLSASLLIFLLWIPLRLRTAAVDQARSDLRRAVGPDASLDRSGRSDANVPLRQEGRR